MGAKKRRKRIGAIVVLGIAASIPTCWIPALRSNTGYNVSPAECPLDVPPQATHVSYYKREAFGPASYCEFDCTPESFLAWAKSKGWEVKRAGEQPYQIMRYGRYAPQAGTDAKLDAPRVSIAHGFFYERMSNPDAGIHVAYDLDSGRGYYYAHTR